MNPDDEDTPPEHAGNDYITDSTEPSADPDRTPSVTCSRCGRSWELTYELDELLAGNRAIERFALDHHRHTGHYPDDVTPWIATCQRCPETEEYLSGRPARRFAEAHARHTHHTVKIVPPDGEPSETISPDDVPGSEPGDDQ